MSKKFTTLEITKIIKLMDLNIYHALNINNVNMMRALDFKLTISSRQTKHVI